VGPAGSSRIKLHQIPLCTKGVAMAGGNGCSPSKRSNRKDCDGVRGPGSTSSWLLLPPRRELIAHSTPNPAATASFPLRRRKLVTKERGQRRRHYQVARLDRLDTDAITLGEDQPFGLARRPMIALTLATINGLVVIAPQVSIASAMQSVLDFLREGDVLMVRAPGVGTSAPQCLQASLGWSMATGGRFVPALFGSKTPRHLCAPACRERRSGGP
jgi:hypothetical protein